ncbi:hypothetical protein NDU88_004618 [Pleurodeles waltl]|uniref:Receptor ligand binding region domain-containing protein n=1 Tax=Pleurodeles waltl TaxID=8319 RepID=A0AAV7KY98_PLEWA|nr:hypothetical protein NDU88_004618 [Pleurodeles waltl]
MRPFRSPLYQRLLAMVFAIEEIYENPALLPNATLGFWMYDTCAEISYGSTVSLLSDKQQFPSFLRTVPSDEHQSRVLADLIGHFGWTWVEIVAEESDYGWLGSQILKAELGRYSACAAFHVGLPVVYSERRVKYVMNVIKESQAKVIVSFSSMKTMLPLRKEAARLNLTGKVWIASEGWAENEQFSDSEFHKVLNGSLRLLIQKSLMPGFRNYMLGIRPSLTPSDIFMRTFWEDVFGCQWPTNETNRTSIDFKLCYGTEDLA